MPHDPASTDLFADQRPAFTVYRSGASARADAAGYIRAGLPLGITATDASAPVRTMAARYASDGGRVFVDSGAFRLIRSGQTIDYRAVLEIYRELLRQTRQPGNLLLVGPDRVGDQIASLALLLRFREAVIDLIDAGATVMIPLQRGPLSLSNVYQHVQHLLQRPLVAGLPSNAAALTEAEIVTFMATAKPDQVHFLGCSENSLLHRAHHASPTTRITCDASRLRCHLGQGRRLTVAQHQHTDEILQAALAGSPDWRGYDATEVCADLDALLQELPDSACQRLADQGGVTRAQLMTAVANDQAFALLDQHGYGFPVVQAWWQKEARRTLSSRGREIAVAQLASEGLI